MTHEHLIRGTERFREPLDEIHGPMSSTGAADRDGEVIAIVARVIGQPAGDERIDVRVHALDLGHRFQELHDLAVDPSNPSVLFAALDIDGVFKSTDGGVTWHRSSKGITDGAYTYAVEIDPMQPSVLYAGTIVAGGVFRSADGGSRWSPMNRGLTSTWVGGLAIDSLGSALYAGTGAYGLDSGGGVFQFQS